MTKAGDGIRRDLEQALTYARGETGKAHYRVHVPAAVDVRAIRSRLGMSQEEFACRFGSEGPTRAHLLAIDRAPRAVQKTLKAAA